MNTIIILDRRLSPSRICSPSVWSM